MWTATFTEVSADPQVRLFTAQCGNPAGRPVLVIHGGPDWDHSYLREPLDAPHRVRRLVIASSTVLPVPPDAFQGWAERDRRLADQADVWSDPALSGPAQTRADAFASAPANVWLPEALPGYLARLEKIQFSYEWAHPWLAGTLPSAQCDDATTRLGALGIPILVLHGRYDMTFPAALAQRAADLIPAVRAIIVDNAGHMAHIDQPEQWLTAVSEFLASPTPVG